MQVARGWRGLGDFALSMSFCDFLENFFRFFYFFLKSEVVFFCDPGFIANIVTDLSPIYRRFFRRFLSPILYPI